MRMMQGMATDAGKQKVQVSENLRLILKGADKLEPDKLIAVVLKLIDTAKDAGLQVGSPPGNFYQMQIRAQSGQSSDTLVVFKIPDRAALEAEAYTAAVANAREKAQRIATLSGVKLGRICYVQDQGATQDASGSQNIFAAIYGAAVVSAGTETKEIESSALTEIPVTVRLAVKFEIEK
jgi:hypothetical protein